jgi:hypothetical protein
MQSSRQHLHHSSCLTAVSNMGLVNAAAMAALHAGFKPYWMTQALLWS